MSKLIGLWKGFLDKLVLIGLLLLAFSAAGSIWVILGKIGVFVVVLLLCLVLGRVYRSK